MYFHVYVHTYVQHVGVYVETAFTHTCSSEQRCKYWVIRAGQQGAHVLLRKLCTHKVQKVVKQSLKSTQFYEQYFNQMLKTLKSFNMPMPIFSELPSCQVVFLWFSLSYIHRDSTPYDRNSTVRQIGRATEGGSTVRRQAGKEAESRGGSVKDRERARWRWWWRENEAVVVYITSPGWSLACVRGLSHQSLHLCKITSWLQYC